MLMAIVSSLAGLGRRAQAGADAPTTLALSDRGTVRAWPRSGWLHAERRSATNEIVWHVVLGPAEPGHRPLVAEDRGTVTLSGGPGKPAVKDNGMWLRLLRAADSGPADDLLKPATLGFEKLTTSAGLGGRQVTRWRKGDWIYIGIGDDRDRLQVFVRLVHRGVARGLPSVGAVRDSLFASTDERYQLFDDGLITGAVVMPEELASKTLARAGLKGNRAPELSVARWLNVDSKVPPPSPSSGAVTVLVFWGVWCAPCVEHLPQLQALHDRFKQAGIRVISVHSAWGSEPLEAFLRDRRFSLPVAVDAGHSAESYGVESWPSFFLIDRQGKVRSAHGHEPPTDKEIKDLL
jgi:peroxiredoxin